MARLGALAQLELDHLYLWVGGLLGKANRIETSVCRAATEITAADLPDKVTAKLPMIGADAAFARVMSKAAQHGPFVQGQNGVRTQRTETHCRDVEDGSRIRLGAVVPTDWDPERARIRRSLRHRRVCNELIAIFVDVDGKPNAISANKTTIVTTNVAAALVVKKMISNKKNTDQAERNAPQIAPGTSWKEPKGSGSGNSRS